MLLRCLSDAGCLPQMEAAHHDNEHLDLKDRNWNWRVEQYEYAEDRARSQPGYVGRLVWRATACHSMSCHDDSYAMDGLCMALNCVWSTTSLEQAMLKAANLCGDADTVCAITAQVCCDTTA